MIECNLKIRRAEREDCIDIYSLMCEFAEYVKLRDKLKVDIETLESELFDNKSAVVLIAELNDKPIGYALYFTFFSSFIGKRGIHLEDLYISPKHRNKGYGKTLLKTIAENALKNNFIRIQWSCLKWNAKAIDFYNSIGAKLYDDSVVFKLENEKMKELIDKI